MGRGAAIGVDLSLFLGRPGAHGMGSTERPGRPTCAWLQYIASGHLPHPGDAMNTWSREAFSCHRVFPYGQVTAIPCGDVAAPSNYPEGGTNTASGWPPLYYVVAAVFVRLTSLVGMDHLYGARLASASLWALGAAALVALAARRGASLTAAVSAGLLCGVIPVATVLGAFVTPHSAQLLLSVLLCAVAIDVIEAEEITRRHFADSHRGGILGGRDCPACTRRRGDCSIGHRHGPKKPQSATPPIRPCWCGDARNWRSRVRRVAAFGLPTDNGFHRDGQPGRCLCSG